MQDFAFWPVLCGALAYFFVGALWYGVLFGKAWQKASGMSDEAVQGGNMPLIFGLTLLLEFIIASVLWHLIARTMPAPHVVMMMAVGFAGGVMIPAVGVHYLYLRKSLMHFIIDAGHMLFGMAAMGAVMLLFM